MGIWKLAVVSGILSKGLAEWKIGCMLCEYVKFTVLFKLRYSRTLILIKNLNYC